MAYNTLYTNSFQGANENPLSDGGKWFSGGDAPLEILNGACVGSDLPTFGIGSSWLAGVELTADQWASYEIDTTNEGSPTYNSFNCTMWMRAPGVQSTGYAIFVNAEETYLGPWMGVNLTDPYSNQLASGIFENESSVGDTVFLSCIGSLITGQYIPVAPGGLLTLSVTNTVLSSDGIPGLNVIWPSTALINFKTGSFTGPFNQVSGATFSPAGGAGYTTTQSVTLANADSGLAGFHMYYTTDGSQPTTSSTLYTGGTISAPLGTTINVLSVATGYPNSGIASATYSSNPPYNPALPYLGQVRVVTQVPAGQSPAKFIGTIVSIASAPAGLSNSYLGTVIAGVPSAGDTNPALGQVVEVASAPAGEADPFLGAVEGS